MTYHTGDTICAVATADGGGARGMVRVSGYDATQIVSQLFESASLISIAEVRRSTAIAGHLCVDLDAQHGADLKIGHGSQASSFSRLPCDLFLWPSAKSYTREPVAELHTIGSPPLLQALVASLCHAGARLAEPGEFTLRAFLAGRLDLTQAESVLGVIDAHGDEELRGAIAQLAGGIARPLYELREMLLQLLSELEAGLDFVDEDIEFVSADVAWYRLNSAQQLLSRLTNQMTARNLAGANIEIALIGAQNAGKSSLFNALVARYAPVRNAHGDDWSPALVSSQLGTTRDYLTATIDLGGLRCELIDTAGVDGGGTFTEADSASSQFAGIDNTAQAFAAAQSKRAAMRVWCIDATRAEKAYQLNKACEIAVLTKCDLRHSSPTLLNLPAEIPVVETSSRTGDGLDQLCESIRSLLLKETGAQRGQVVPATAVRCSESIRLAEAALQRAADILNTSGGDELVAAELRMALNELGKVVGAVYTDDILDRIFSTFCIGK
jgi:tRNA modification GTPase